MWFFLWSHSQRMAVLTKHINLRRNSNLHLLKSMEKKLLYQSTESPPYSLPLFSPLQILFSACSDGPPFLHHHLSLRFLQRRLLPFFLSFSLLFSLSQPFASHLATQTLYFSAHSQILYYKVLRTSLGEIASSLMWGTGREAE